jgi:hypothetical protein
VLALLAMLVGGAATLGVAEVWLQNWLRSGQSFPVGRRGVVQLPAGKSLVYYESLVAVPHDGDSGATLKVEDADDEPMPVRAIRAYRDDGPGDGSMEYRLWLSGWSGRALWEIDAPAAGRYSLQCHNHSVLSDNDLPAEDRIAVLRSPNSFAQVRTLRTIMLITGGTITMTAVIILYMLHSLALKRRPAGVTVIAVDPSE